MSGPGLETLQFNTAESNKLQRFYRNGTRLLIYFFHILLCDEPYIYNAFSDPAISLHALQA